MKKPILGIKPKQIVKQIRIGEILEGIQRYNDEGLQCPTEWIRELSQLNNSMPLSKGELPLNQRPIKPISSSFSKELTELINRYNVDGKTNTPDFLLAEFLCKTIEVYSELNIGISDWKRGSQVTNIEGIIK